MEIKLNERTILLQKDDRSSMDYLCVIWWWMCVRVWWGGRWTVITGLLCNALVKLYCFSDLTWVICLMTLPTASWELTEGAVQDASVCGMWPSASTPTGWPQGWSEGLGMLGQYKRNKPSRPCFGPVGQHYSLSGPGLATSKTLSVGMLQTKGNKWSPVNRCWRNTWKILKFTRKKFLFGSACICSNRLR